MQSGWKARFTLHKPGRRSIKISPQIRTTESSCCGCCAIRMEIRIYITQANRGALNHRDHHYNQFPKQKTNKLLLWYLLLCNQGGNQDLRYTTPGVAMDHRDHRYNQFPSQNNCKLLLLKLLLLLELCYLWFQRKRSLEALKH